MATSPSLPFPQAWLGSARLRRAVALSAVVLATGGLVLSKAGSSVAWTPPDFPAREASGASSVTFSGPGAHGVLRLSHSKVLPGQATPIYAELRLSADARTTAAARPPLALAIVLDTSGSMTGEKIEDARRSVLRLVSSMHDDDEVALVRYSDTSELVQPLTRVGQVRATLAARIRGLEPGGGTNIPSGLSSGLRALDDAARDRVRRLVLVSDGLDSTRAQAESLAAASFSSGITVSSLGIGLDFDEGYMGSVAQSGHGNFGFVRDGASLATFLKRELDETAATTIEDARVDLHLPRGVRFVTATGAEASTSDGIVELRLGSLFAGDTRRVLVELTADAPAQIAAEARWRQVGEATREIPIPSLGLVAATDAADVERGRDGLVLASATSVLASKRQLEAASAYARGDVTTATRLTAENEAALGAALAAAPTAAAPALSAQMSAYGDQKRAFRAASPRSAEGRATAKSATMRDVSNLDRAGF